MDMHTLKNKKCIDVKDNIGGMVKDYHMGFPIGGMDLVEPAYACAMHHEGGELHGMAFGCTQAEMNRLDAMEGM